MAILTETELSAGLKNGQISSLYFLYGTEKFLVKSYAERIRMKILPSGDEMNLLEIVGNPDLDFLSQSITAVPFFADKRVILLNDFAPDKLSDNQLDDYLAVLMDVPDTTVLVIYITSPDFSQKNGATKKFVNFMKKNAAVCEFKPLTVMKIGELVARKCAKAKRLISRTNAEYLAEITACDLGLASIETTKLCDYVEEGHEITREVIDLMVAKKLETKAYLLANTIFGGKVADALLMLDELFFQRAEPIVLLATLGNAYVEYYRAKVAKIKGIPPQTVAEDFNYAANRRFLVARNYKDVEKIEMDRLRSALAILSEADLKLKSTAVNARVLLEETVIRLMGNHNGKN